MSIRLNSGGGPGGEGVGGVSSRREVWGGREGGGPWEGLGRVRDIGRMVKVGSQAMDPRGGRSRSLGWIYMLLGYKVNEYGVGYAWGCYLF